MSIIQLTLPHYWGYINWYNCFKKLLEIATKAKHTHMSFHRNSSHRYMPKKCIHIFTKKHVQNVYISITC